MAFSMDQGLGINVYTALYAPPSFTARQASLGHIGDEISAYTHKIAADGGFLNATFTATLTELLATDWFDNGLGRHIEVQTASGEEVFEGFVNKVSVSIGSLQAVAGPLIEVVNRSLVVYTRIFEDVDPPASGGQWETTIVEDADSQAKYGILEAVFSGGQATLDQADQVNSSYVEDMRNPEKDEDLNIPGASQAAVTVEVLGYFHRLSKYVYESTTNLTEAISSNSGTLGKLQNVLAADPNGIFTVIQADGVLAANAFLVVGHENDNRLALDVIKEMVSIGDVNDARYVFGVYENRVPRYKALPTEYTYKHDIVSVEQEIRTYADDKVVPGYLVRPAFYLYLQNEPTASAGPGFNANDPRALFIEDVTYTWPFGVAINGQRVKTISQKLAKLGLGSL